MVFLQHFIVVLVVTLLCSESSMSRVVQMDYNNTTHSASPANEHKTNSYSTLRKLSAVGNKLIGLKNKTKRTIISVDAFGAKADGRDDSKAFLAAWKKACNTPKSVLLVPSNKTYLLKPPIKFVGHCKPNFIMRIQGTIEASRNMKDYKNDPRKWVVFEHVKDFTVDGGGTFNGNGKVWWQTSCKVSHSKKCRTGRAPTAVTFDNCTNVRVSNLRFVNAQQMQLSFDNCKNVDASNLIVTATKASPNTDGIHVTSTQNIRINNCIIGTGDDCISIVGGSNNVQAMNIVLELGKNHETDIVSDVYVKNVQLLGTTNGLRIKTWQGDRGHAKNIKFEHITLMNVSNPIIIDQNYCDKKEPCHEQKDVVQVKNVVYKNIRGTSASKMTMNFDCSKTVPCENIKVENIHLVAQGVKDVKSFFANAKITVVGDIFPRI